MRHLEIINRVIPIAVFLTLAFAWGNAQDTQAPIINIPPQDSIQDCSLELESAFEEWYLTAGGAMATDNSDSIRFEGIPTYDEALQILLSSSDTLCGTTKNVLVSFYATDTFDNRSDTLVARFATIDTIAPIITRDASEIMFTCNQGVQDSIKAWIDRRGGALAADDCADTLIWTFVWTEQNSSESGQGVVGEGPYIRTDNQGCDRVYNVAFRAADECQPTDFAISFTTLTLTDTEDPYFSYLPVDTIVDCGQIPINDVEAFDFCDGELVIDFTENTNQIPDTTSCGHYNYELTRRWMAEDACGNSIMHEQKITVLDTLKPTFVRPSNRDANCRFEDLPEATGLPSQVSDNGCSNPLVSYVDEFDVGTECLFRINRVWTVTDYCGNDTSQVQVLTFFDDAAPQIIEEAEDRFFSCDDFIDINDDFSQWLNSAGGAMVEEACADLQSFVAVPGSYTLNDEDTYPGTPITELPQQSCPSALGGALRFASVDFVYHDGCGNAVVTNAVYAITDNIKPVFQSCPEDMTLSTESGDCGADFTISFPTANDNCGEDESPIMDTQSMPITSDTPGQNVAIVDTVFFSFGPYNLHNSPANGTVTLTLDLFNADTDDMQEFFVIYDENNMVLDSTEITSMQCQDQSIDLTVTADQINNWASDGFIRFSLVPNNPDALPVFGVNDVCGGSSARMSLSFDIDIQNTLSYQYTIDSQDTLDVPSLPLEVFLAEGMHVLEFFAIDCAGNVGICKQTIEVIDQEAPTLSCPQNITLSTPTDQCEATVLLPIDVLYSDNCSATNSYDFTLPNNGSELLDFSFNTNTNTFLASNQVFVFQNVFPIRYWDQGAKLDIFLAGDIDDPGEYFEILGEDGTVLGSTNIAPMGANCGSETRTQVLIDRDKFNDWISSDGALQITLVANVDTGIEGGGINPCSDISMGSEDDLSRLSIRLSYQDASLSYFTEGATEITIKDFPSNGDQPIEIFNQGITTVSYLAQDAAGNADTCTFEVEVIDEQLPEITCQNAVAFIHPSGLIEYVLDETELTTSISDNCMLVDTVITPAAFDCNNVGNEIPVEVEISDVQGNVAACFSIVKVEMAPLTPSFTSGVCQDDTLKLFANIEEAPIANAYTFFWSGPNNFESSLEDPFILNPDPSYSGTYFLEVEGFNGCVSMGTVEVSVEQLVTPEITVASEQVCQGDEVLLNATPFSGDLLYRWYEGFFPNGVLIETTDAPSLLIAPSDGEHFYYVIVESPNCTTSPSPNRKIEVLDPPIAQVESPFLTVCEGSEITLSALEFNPGYQYFWNGPDNYESTGQFPEVIQNASIDNQGAYSLVIQLGTCMSDTARTQVAIIDKPEEPTIVGDKLLCEGATLILSVNNVSNADVYKWYLDGSLFTVTNSNSLAIPGVTSDVAGDWEVTLIDNLCESDSSDIFDIVVEDEIQISASNDGPGCVGDSIQLLVAEVPNAVYEWSTPTLDTIRGIRTPKVLASQGTYTVTVTTTGGCENITSTFVEVETVPIITALSNDALDCISEGDTIRFFPTVIPSTGNYSFTWNGPEILDNVINPIVDNASLNSVGTYSLVVSNGVCDSESVETQVDFSLIPTTPSIDTTGHCLGQDIALLTEDYQGNEVSYQWSTPLGRIDTDDPILNIENSTNDDEGDYEVIVVVDGCASDTSDVVAIELQIPPDQASILSDNAICEGDTLFLVSDANEGLDFYWEGPNEFSSSDPNPFVANANSNDSGQYRLRVSDNGCASEWSDPLLLIVIENPAAPMFEEALYNVCLGLDTEVEVCIDANTTMPDAQYYLWINGTEFGNQDTRCINIALSNSLLNVGDNVLQFQTELNGCRSPQSQSAILEIDTRPSEFAMIQEDIPVYCVDEIIQVNAENPGIADLMIRWSSTNNNLAFDNELSEVTWVENLEVGFNEIVLSSSAGACIDYASDTIEIEVIDLPNGQEDIFNIPYNSDATLDVLDNDQFSENFFFEISEQPDFGELTILSNNIRYTADPSFVGEQDFFYTICNEECPDNCIEVKATIIVGNDIPCVVPSIITPNQDGANDFLVIPCLSSGLFPNNKLTVFNEWGDEVFYAEPYDNDWEGTHNGDPLPVGTYYFVFDAGNDSDQISGFLIIQK